MKLLANNFQNSSYSFKRTKTEHVTINNKDYVALSEKDYRDKKHKEKLVVLGFLIFITSIGLDRVFDIFEKIKRKK